MLGVGATGGGAEARQKDRKLVAAHKSYYRIWLPIWLPICTGWLDDCLALPGWILDGCKGR